MEQEDKEKIEKQKEREKRINQKRKLEENDRKFEIDTESVINMTNKNKIKKEEEKRKKISKEERKRKDYKDALEADRNEIKKGNYNYKGIGF